MTGQEAVNRIHEKAWTGRKPGLSRTIELLRRLGNPQDNLKFIHITGTNGKGSTAAMVASILAKSGLRTGLYTSPHLWQFHERFQINGVPIPDPILGEIAQQVILAGEDLNDPATEFELMTAIGMQYFAQEGCEIVVLEVGLGGRLDSTNVIPAPEVAVITNIGLEHTRELGNRLSLIAKEKAGIIKPGCDTVLYHQSHEVEEVVEETCREVGSSLVRTAPHTLRVLSSGRDGQTFLYRNQGPFQISLLGRHQLYNAAVALDVVWTLNRRRRRISPEAVIQGLRDAVWPARMELVRRSPDILLDGGHNPQCIAALRQSLEELYPGKKILFLVGMLEDKDYPAMLDQMIPLAKLFVTVTPDSPRALSAQDLAQHLCQAGAEAQPCDSIAQGVERVLSMAEAEDVICICGSLYMVGEVRHILGLY